MLAIDEAVLFPIQYYIIHGSPHCDSLQYKTLDISLRDNRRP